MFTTKDIEKSRRKRRAVETSDESAAEKILDASEYVKSRLSKSFDPVKCEIPVFQERS